PGRPPPAASAPRNAAGRGSPTPARRRIRRRSGARSAAPAAPRRAAARPCRARPAGWRDRRRGCPAWCRPAPASTALDVLEQPPLLRDLAVGQRILRLVLVRILA